MKNLIITESEKNRILGMHQTKKQYLMEKPTGTTKTTTVSAPTKTWDTVASEAADYLGANMTQTTNEDKFLNLIYTNIRSKVDLNSLKTAYNKLTKLGVENYDDDLKSGLSYSPNYKRDYDNYINKLK
jgi:hypothetical protein